VETDEPAPYRRSPSFKIPVGGGGEPLWRLKSTLVFVKYRWFNGDYNRELLKHLEVSLKSLIHAIFKTHILFILFFLRSKTSDERRS
jgi:hypothetical protein